MRTLNLFLSITIVGGNNVMETAGLVWLCGLKKNDRQERGFSLEKIL